jgi:hypothetical protein
MPSRLLERVSQPIGEQGEVREVRYGVVMRAMARRPLGGPCPRQHGVVLGNAFRQCVANVKRSYERYVRYAEVTPEFCVGGQ